MKLFFLLFMLLNPIMLQSQAFAERVADFSFTPVDGTTGVPIIFDASHSICTIGPCTYKWTDDANNSTLGTGITLTSTFQQTGLKLIHLTITDAKGQTASIQHDVVVMNTVSAQALAAKTWGTPARTAIMSSFDGVQWSDMPCVGKQEYAPAILQTAFGPEPNPSAGQPRMWDNRPMPTWLGCGVTWQAAFRSAGVAVQ